MLAVEDYLDTLKWAESLGGLGGLLGRVAENMGVLTLGLRRLIGRHFV